MATFYKMTLCPTQDGYSVQHPFSINRMQLDGGATRFRKGKKGLPSSVSVQWVVDKNGYDYLLAFYRLWEAQTPKINPFLLDLIIDESALLEYSCFFSGGLVLSAVNGPIRTVTATLEVIAKKPDTTVDEIIILGVLDLINPLEELVNEDLPNAVGGL